MTYLTFTLLIAVLLAAAMAALGERSSRERCYVAAYVFVTCAISVVAGSWAMYFIHG